MPDADDFYGVLLFVDPVNDSTGAFDDFPDLFIIKFGYHAPGEREVGEAFNGIKQG